MMGNLKESNPLLILAGIVLIPIGVAVVSLWVDTRIDERQRQAADELFERQEKLIVTQTIDSYFQGVGALLSTDSDLTKRDQLIVARSNALLGRLNYASDKALIVRFISELQPELTARPERMLERSSKPFVDLADLDLSGADLSYVNLYRANLSGANLQGASLVWANLAGASLRGVTLDGADIRGAELSGSNLSGASLKQARIGGASFESADLGGADLSDADRSSFEFEDLTTETNLGNAILSGTIWFDGVRCAEKSLGRCDP